MTRYLLTIYQSEGPPPPRESLAAVMRNVDAVREEMRAVGAWVFSGGLHPPSTATVVRLRDGELLMTDGPYAEGKEHVGGFTVVEAPDLDDALEWARKLASALTLDQRGGLPVEVRPFQDGVA